MARQATIIGQATDYEGVIWDVREKRPTQHSFDIYIGWPQGEARGKGGRGVATILTAELAHYLSQTRTKDIDLPIGSTTVKVLRRKLGLRWSWDEWWVLRSKDLKSMTLEAFCTRHGCSIGAASQRRTEFKSKGWGKRQEWTPEEDALIRQDYPTLGSLIADRMPGRTRTAITLRAGKIGARLRGQGVAWTPEEDRILIETYPVDPVLTEKKLPGRTLSAIRYRATYLKISVQKNGKQKRPRKPWTFEEDVLLREHYPVIGMGVSEMLPGRAEEVIMVKASKLGLTRPKNSAWSDAEIAVLKKHYPEIGSKVSAMLPTRSETAVRTQALKLGLKRWGKNER